MNTINYLNSKFIDVRSQAEYIKGHISGAINIPILSELERAEVGHLYKNVSKDKAKLKGLIYGSAKLQDFYQQISNIAQKHQNIVIYCARGGYRSKSVHSILQSIDLPTTRLEGGYKAYRAMVLSTLNQHDESKIPIPSFIPINGLTGSGKTKILRYLKQIGHPVLDLEGAANHKGSTLGAIGEKAQNAQQFENDLFTQLLEIHTNGQKYAFIEMESRKIGKLVVPKVIFEAYHNKPAIVISIPIESRISNLHEDYVGAKNLENELKVAIPKLRAYIAKSIMEEIENSYENKDYSKMIKLLLEHHYDAHYMKSIDKKQPLAEFKGDNLKEIAANISNWVKLGQF